MNAAHADRLSRAGDVEYAVGAYERAIALTQTLSAAGLERRFGALG